MGRRRITDESEDPGRSGVIEEPAALDGAGCPPGMENVFDGLGKDEPTKPRPRTSKPRKSTPPPLPSDSPMRVLEDDKIGTRVVLPDGEPPSRDESARQKEVLAAAGKYHEKLAGLASDFREFLSREVSHNRQLTAFQRAWLEGAGFQLQRAFEFIEVAIRGKV